MLSVEQALALVLEGLTPLESEEVPLAEARGRVAAEVMRASCALPAFDNSAMDGYALRAADVREAAEGRPVSLQVTAEIAAGASTPRAMGPGEAARIFTGAPVPPGADAVVMQEDVRRDGALLLVAEPVPAGSNIRRAGEDVSVGAALIERGAALHAGELGMLAAQDRARVRVVRRARVAIVSSGDELIDVGQTPRRPGTVVNSNAYMLEAQARDVGAVVSRGPIVRDDPDAIRAALDAAAAGADLVLTCGGMSVGDHDHTSRVLAEGGAVAFHKVAMKPGKPIAFGRWRGVPLLGLPGNPVSAFVGFVLFAWPALRRLGGHTHASPRHVRARLPRSVRPHATRVELLRARLVDEGGDAPMAILHDKQGSAALSSLLGADVLVEIQPGEASLAAGTLVKAIRLPGAP